MSHQFQTLNDLHNYTIHDSKNRFVFINYAGVKRNTAPSVQPADIESYSFEIATNKQFMMRINVNEGHNIRYATVTVPLRL
jgi:hypothetical protein